MKNQRIIFLLLAISVLVTMSCNDFGDAFEGSEVVNGVTLSKTSTALPVGATEQLSATISPENATNKSVIWTSDSPGIAMVSSSGLVVGVSVGNTTITVTTIEGGKTTKCDVEVTEGVVAVTGVSLDKTSSIIVVGGMVQLSPTISPQNATNQNIIWESDSSGVATVSPGGLVTGVSAGSATITAKVKNTSRIANCMVTVNKASLGGAVSTFTLGGISFNMIAATGSEIVSPGITFPTGVSEDKTATINTPFAVAETLTTYELWSVVCAWAKTHGYAFANPGQMGSAQTGNANIAGGAKQPVIAVNWRDAMVWCNALTEYYNANRGSSPALAYVYCTDTTYTTPIRSCDNNSAVSTAAGTQDNPCVNSAANGFRLLTSNEYEFASRYIGITAPSPNYAVYNTGHIFTALTPGYYWTPGTYVSGDFSGPVWPPSGIGQSANAQDYAVYGSFLDENDNWLSTGVTVTAAVKSKKPNALGLYDMSGNAYAWCFDWYSGSERIVRGGAFDSNTFNMQIGLNGHRHVSYEPHYEISFRFARNY